MDVRLVSELCHHEAIVNGLRFLTSRPGPGLSSCCCSQPLFPFPPHPYRLAVLPLRLCTSGERWDRISEETFCRIRVAPWVPSHAGSW
jgi:hypothetical protein